MSPKTLVNGGSFQDLERMLTAWDSDGLTVTQLRLLIFLGNHEGATNAEAADHLGVTRPSVSALLDRLERGRFVRRAIAPHDRRAIAIFLEPRGKEALDLESLGKN